MKKEEIRNKETISYLEEIFSRRLLISNPMDFNIPGMLQAIQAIQREEQQDTRLSNCSEILYFTSKDCYEADDRGAVKALTPPNKTNGRSTIRSELPASFLVRQMSSSCFGAKSLYVPVLKFTDKPSRRNLIKLQKAYNLGDLYTFQYHLGYFVISPKTAQFGRLTKIYRKLGRNLKSYNELVKFRQNFIYTSNIIDLEGMRKMDTFKFIDVIEQEANGWYSRPHAMWLKKYLNKNYNNLVGSNPRFSIGRFENDRQGR